MLIKFETPNGSMSIVAERFFPATKKDLKKLKKAMVNPEDIQKIETAIDNMIEQISIYANDCKARKEIHQMALKEELEESFAYEAEGRKMVFYDLECKKSREVIAALNQNKEDLRG